MQILFELKAAFPNCPAELTDEYIEQNPDPIRADPTNNWLVLMPAYMSWCIRSPRRNELLVIDHTVDALANFGRFSGSGPSHLNFKSLCNSEQRAAVARFLQWCLEGNALVHEEQVKRSLKHWLPNSSLRPLASIGG